MDVTNCRLIDALSFASYPCTLGGTGALCLSNTLANGDLYQRLLAEFPDITTPTFSSVVAKHGVEHYITTVGPPVYARARRLDSAKLAIAREEFATMEPGRSLVPSTWASTMRPWLWIKWRTLRCKPTGRPPRRCSWKM